MNEAFFSQSFLTFGEIVSDWREESFKRSGPGCFLRGERSHPWFSPVNSGVSYSQSVSDHIISNMPMAYRWGCCYSLGETVK